MLEGLLIGGVALIIINLVVRDQSQYRLGRLRSDLMGLRSEEKRVSERRDEVELMVAQIGDALMRADRRRQSLERGCGSLQSMLDEVSSRVDGDAGGATEDEG